MRMTDFERMLEGLVAEIPAEFRDGVIEIAASPLEVPHPVRADVFTLGECIPEPLTEGSYRDGVQSRIVLYHGSFQALARRDPSFAWRAEAWETLTHELRHHLEWRARADDLERLDAAAEHNFARHEGEPFDPLFFLDGEQVGEGLYQVDHDFFLDQVVDRVPPRVVFTWHGQEYAVDLPADLTLPALLTVEGLRAPPPGELVLVLRHPPSILELFRGAEPVAGEVRARPVPSPGVSAPSA